MRRLFVIKESPIKSLRDHDGSGSTPFTSNGRDHSAIFLVTGPSHRKRLLGVSAGGKSNGSAPKAVLARGNPKRRAVLRKSQVAVPAMSTPAPTTIDNWMLIPRAQAETTKSGAYFMAA